MPRKLSAIRQFSLQCETPPSSATTRRASLKKQHSEELGDADVGIRISLSAKAALRNPKPPIKIAWGDDEPSTRPVQPFRRHSHHQTTDEGGGGGVTGKAALYSRQDLAQKLHLAWQDRENTKNKLNIFLAHNFQPEPAEELLTQTPRPLTQNVTEPKLMQPLLPHHNEAHSNDANINLKQIFQKHLRKSKISSPVGSDSEPAAAVQAVVVVPIIERSRPNLTPAHHTPRERKHEDPKTIRPQTATTTSAAQKRAMFQKRTNSAFQSLNSACSSPIPPPPQRQFRPPMVRASSLPASSKPPDIQVKTRLRKKIKVYKRGKHHASKDIDDEKKNSDVVTMVSLVSSSESEAEDADIKEEDPKLPPANSPKKSTPSNEKHFSLRKTVKQVSFQHSSIHAVRSFSASFPARRASVGASLLLDNAAKKLQKSLEKRGQPDEGLADAKRRLLQPHANNNHNQQNNAEGDESARSTQNILPDTTRLEKEAAPTSEEHMKSNGGANKENQDGGETHKERKCWETYCRMTKSGLNVSFDTILRGMLTPTEYRLRRRLSLQTAEEETEDTNRNEECRILNRKPS